MKAVLASKNPHKLAEIQTILSGLGVEVVMESELGLDIDVDETGTTFEENSRLKAEAVMRAANMPAIADDSGLMVDALDARRACILRATARRATTERTTSASRSCSKT